MDYKIQQFIKILCLKMKIEFINILKTIGEMYLYKIQIHHFIVGMETQKGLDKSTNLFKVLENS